MTPREAGIQAFYADESTTNTLQGLNAAFDAYEAAAKPAHDEAIRVLRLISEGYRVSGHDDRYIRVENPDYRPDNGSNPFIVIDVAALSKAKEA